MGVEEIVSPAGGMAGRAFFICRLRRVP